MNVLVGARRCARAPSPRVRGEGRGEGALPQTPRSRIGPLIPTFSPHAGRRSAGAVLTSHARISLLSEIGGRDRLAGRLARGTREGDTALLQAIDAGRGRQRLGDVLLDDDERG